MIIFTVPLEPRSKKNNQQIVRIGSRLAVIQNKRYRDFEKNCGQYIPKIDKPIDYPIHLVYSFYRSTRRRVDLTNLQEAMDDVLCKYKFIADDNRDIVASHDGSRVYYDKENPRIVVRAIRLSDEEYEQWSKKPKGSVKKK